MITSRRANSLIAILLLSSSTGGYAVEEGVFLDPATGNYTVRYVAPADGEGPASVVEGTFFPRTKIVPMLTSSFESNQTDKIDYAYSALNSFASQQPLIMLGVPCNGFVVLEQPTSPPIWRPTVNASNQVPQTRNVRWGFNDYDDNPSLATKGLQLGEKLSGFGFVSSHLPGVAGACFRGNAPFHTFSDQWLDSKSPVWTQLVQLKKNDRVLRFAAIPTFSVPNPFSGVPLLEQLRDHVKGWPQQQLMEQAFWQQIDGLLAAAINALKNGDTAGAASNLAQIRVELRKKYPDLDVMTALDDPKASALPTAPDALKAYLSAHDQRLAAKVLDFDVAYVMDRLGVSVPIPDAKTPVIAISPSKQVVEGNSGTTTLPFDVYRVGDLARESKVSFATKVVTPNDGDYIAASGVVNLPIGSEHATITVTINGDRVTEPTETFLVTLSNPDNARIGSDTAIGLIIDDDPSSSDLTHPQPTITISPSNQVVEGNTGTTTISVEVYRVGDLKGSSSVAYTTQDLTATSADYVPSSGQLNFAPGAQKAMIVITILGDTVPEASESLLVRLSAPVNATLSGDAGVVTIIDDDH